MRVSCSTLDFAVPIITLHQKNKSCQRVKNEAAQIEIMTRVTCDTQNWKMLWEKKKQKKTVSFDTDKLDLYCRLSQAATARGILQRMT